MTGGLLFSLISALIERRYSTQQRGTFVSNATLVVILSLGVYKGLCLDTVTQCFAGPRRHRLRALPLPRRPPGRRFL